MKNRETYLKIILDDLALLSKQVEYRNTINLYDLQDISIQYLDATQNDPVKALNTLVTYFQDKISASGKNYDRMAIKFYLVNEMIKCRVFPNKRGE